MNRSFFSAIAFLLLIIPQFAKAEMSVWCGIQNNDLFCFGGHGLTFDVADQEAQRLCNAQCGLDYKATVRCEDGAYPAVVCPNCGKETKNFDDERIVDEMERFERSMRQP